MKKILTIAFASFAALSLAACGKSDDASEAASADTVEMPADELPAMEPSAAAPAMVDEPAPDASSAADAQANAARDAATNASAVADAAKAAAAEAQAATAE